MTLKSLILLTFFITCISSEEQSKISYAETQKNIKLAIAYVHNKTNNDIQLNIQIPQQPSGTDGALKEMPFRLRPEKTIVVHTALPALKAYLETIYSGKTHQYVLLAFIKNNNLYITLANPQLRMQIGESPILYSVNTYPIDPLKQTYLINLEIKSSSENTHRHI